MKKLILTILVCISVNCFAGTLHIRHITFSNVTLEGIYGSNIVKFKTSSGKSILVGPGIEWWYEE